MDTAWQGRATVPLFDLEVRNGNLVKAVVTWGESGAKIKVPSAMWPLKGNHNYFFTSESTVPCTDEEIKAIYESVQVETGKCYQNAERLRTALVKAGYPAKLCCGWMFYSDTIPVHHAVVVMHGDAIQGGDKMMVFDSTSIDYTEAEAVVPTMTPDAGRKWFIDWIVSLQNKPRSSYTTFGKAMPNTAYIVAECSYEDAVKTRAKLAKAYPKHPALGGFCTDDKTEIQKELQRKGLQ